MVYNDFEASSFRDPSGRIFYDKGSILRSVNLFYKNNYDLLINSGLYETLVKKRLLVSHEEKSAAFLHNRECYKIIAPERIPFVTYPYEWCFSQLKDAALLTLTIQNLSLECGMSLKDCSGYNIQYLKGRPIFIDTLSFEKYHEGEPWVAYKQFCQHFLAPLVMMSLKDVRLSQLLRIYTDGIPLDLTSTVLPPITWINPAAFIHVHLHARAQKFFHSNHRKVLKGQMSLFQMRAMIDNIETFIGNLKISSSGSIWLDYYSGDSYSCCASKHKEKLVKEYIDIVNPLMLWDLGSNTGLHTRVSDKKNIFSIAIDSDHEVVEANYRRCRSVNEENILPIWLDLMNPSGGLGWDNSERMSLKERGQPDVILALALIHHLSISNNVSFDMIAKYFYSLGCKWLIIEFVPKNDQKAKLLLLNREDIFPDYTQENFETVFKTFFEIVKINHICESKRIIYLMKSR